MVFLARNKILLVGYKLILRYAKSYVNLAHVFEVSCALDHRHDLFLNVWASTLVFLFMEDILAVILVIVATKDEIYSDNLFCKNKVMVHPHVSQSDHHVASLLLFQFSDIFSGCSLVVAVNKVNF